MNTWFVPWSSTLRKAHHTLLLLCLGCTLFCCSSFLPRSCYLSAVRFTIVDQGAAASTSSVAAETGHGVVFANDKLTQSAHLRKREMYLVHFLPLAYDDRTMSYACTVQWMNSAASLPLIIKIKNCSTASLLGIQGENNDWCKHMHNVLCLGLWILSRRPQHCHVDDMCTLTPTNSIANLLLPTCLDDESLWPKRRCFW